MPEISVVTCVHNGEKYLAETIESVLSQYYTDFQYIIVNDASIDKSQNIIDKYRALDKRLISIVTNKKNPAAARNMAIDMASGKYIAIIDGDDICMPERLIEQVSYINKHKNCVLLGSGCIEIDSLGKNVKKHRYPKNHLKLLNNLEKAKKFFPHSSALYRRKAYEIVSRYNERFYLCEDYDLFFRLAEVGEVNCLDRPLIKLRKHKESMFYLHALKDIMISQIAAFLCHYARANLLADPAQETDHNAWNCFLIWIESQQPFEDLVEESRQWINFKNILREGRKKRWVDKLFIGKTALMSKPTGDVLCHRAFGSPHILRLVKRYRDNIKK